jgi:hypothetical protein
MCKSQKQKDLKKHNQMSYEKRSGMLRDQILEESEASNASPLEISGVSATDSIIPSITYPTPNPTKLTRCAKESTDVNASWNKHGIK